MIMSQVKDKLMRNVDAVQARIEVACRRAGRRRNEVTLVAVTKSVTAEVAAILPELSIVDLGENRPQDLWHKAAVLPKTVRWHLIGHLQRNKVDRTLPLVHLFHSVDSLRLLTALEAEAGKCQRSISVLLEINASREANKHGFALEELPDLVPRLATLQHVRIHGLMTMAAQEDDPERCRPTFAEVRRLRDRLKEELAEPHHLEELSMGMTNDFEVAVEEGATLVRIGTALFAGLQE